MAFNIDWYKTKSKLHLVLIYRSSSMKLRALTLIESRPNKTETPEMYFLLLLLEMTRWENQQE